MNRLSMSCPITTSGSKNELNNDVRKAARNKALDARPPNASLMKSMLIGGGRVNADVRWLQNDFAANLRIAVII